MKENSLQNFLFIGVIALLAILIFNSFFVFSMGSSLDKKIKEAKELARPAKVEIIKLESSCNDCFDIDTIINTLKKSGLEITNEKSLPRNSKEAVELINKYGIKKLPIIILKGETEKASIQNFKKIDDVLVFDAIVPPYEDITTKKIIGKVSSIIINDKNCKFCANFSLSVQNLKQSGIFIDKKEEFDFSNTKAKELIGKFNIKKIPALLLSKDIDAYPEIAQNLNQISIEKDNYYIIESQAPYVEPESGKIRGLITLTMLNDSSCSKCYDVMIHKQILSRMGLAIDKENKIDTGSENGKQLIDKYKIKSVPTIILTGDLGVYVGFDKVWEQVGSVETDGAYAFRYIDVLGSGIVYKNLTSGEIKTVMPVTQQS